MCRSRWRGRPSSSSAVRKRVSRNFTRRGVAGQKIAVPSNLVRVWNIASEVAGPGSRRSKAAVWATSHNSTGSMMKATTPTTTLNSTWAMAARRAAEVAPMTANRAVEVVPTLAPMTIAAAEVSGITPVPAAVRVMASEALDEFITTVITTPMATNISKLKTPLPVYSASSNPSPKSPKLPLSTSRPRKKMPKPVSASPR